MQWKKFSYIIECFSLKKAKTSHLFRKINEDLVIIVINNGFRLSVIPVKTSCVNTAQLLSFVRNCSSAHKKVKII